MRIPLNHDLQFLQHPVCEIDYVVPLFPVRVTNAVAAHNLLTPNEEFEIHLVTGEIYGEVERPAWLVLFLRFGIQFLGKIYPEKVSHDHPFGLLLEVLENLRVVGFAKLIDYVLFHDISLVFLS
jgi:hypothetical protein